MADQAIALLDAWSECKRDVINQSYPTDGRLYCTPMWDGWGCWNYTLAGTSAVLPCPAYKEGFDPRLPRSRDCNEDGTWWTIPGRNKTWSNYTVCVNENELEKDKQVVYVFIAGYSISIVAILISLVIFFSFRQLHCDRVTIHKNLFISYILNGIVWILYYSLAALDGSVLNNSPIWCQVLHVITQYFVTCNFFWMFCEGLYLHTIIVAAFTTGKKLLFSCCIIGWCGPILPATVYTILRAHNAEECLSCWLNDSSKSWIVFGPIIATILMNLLFLCNIVRVLITKLRACNSPDTNQTRRAVRATLILIPLLGLQYFLFPFKPEEGTIMEETYNLASALVTSFQGLFVALIFCFFNGEVISVIKRKWGQHQLMHGGGKSVLYTQTCMSTMEPDSHRVSNAGRPSGAGAGASGTQNGHQGGKKYGASAMAPETVCLQDFNASAQQAPEPV